MFVNRMGVGSMVGWLVSTSGRSVEGVSPTALWPLTIRINTGHRSSTTRYDNILGVAFGRPFSDLK